MIDHAIDKQVTLYFKNSNLTFAGTLVQIDPIILKSNTSLFVVEDESSILGYIVSEEKPEKVDLEKIPELEKLKASSLQEIRNIKEKYSKPAAKQMAKYDTPKFYKK